MILFLLVPETAFTMANKTTVQAFWGFFSARNVMRYYGQKGGGQFFKVHRPSSFI
jgi:hypothetical protein